MVGAGTAKEPTIRHGPFSRVFSELASLCVEFRDLLAIYERGIKLDLPIHPLVVRRNVRKLALLTALIMAIAACGGSGTDPETEGDQNAPAQDSDGGEREAPPVSPDVVDRQPSGQAHVVVDGLDYTFDTFGPSDCNVESFQFGFSFIIGENEVSLTGGGTSNIQEWATNLAMRVFNATDDGAPVTYANPVGSGSDGLAIDGNSVSYSGPIEKKVPNADPVDVGEGTISVTC